MLATVPVILWVLFTSATAPLDARPALQFENMPTCLTWVTDYRQTDRFKADDVKLTEAGITTTLVCLPAGVRP